MVNTIVQEIPYQVRFSSEGFNLEDLQVIVGAINRNLRGLAAKAEVSNLRIFTWGQVKDALRMERRDCTGDALDDLDDLIYAVIKEEKAYGAN